MKSLSLAYTTVVGVYRDKISRDNPLGIGSAIAEVFGVLLD